MALQDHLAGSLHEKKTVKSRDLFFLHFSFVKENMANSRGN